MQHIYIVFLFKKYTLKTAVLWYYRAMRETQVNIRWFAPFNYCKGHNYAYLALLSFSLLTLSGCMTSSNTAPLAPLPPQSAADISHIQNTSDYSPHFFTHITGTELEAMQIASQMDAAIKQVGADPDAVIVDIPADLTSAGGAVSKSPIVSAAALKCSISKRFDRKAMVAYEWDRNRLSVDLDGVTGGETGMRVEYKIRLQPEKTRAQKCRYNSKWQGLVGSGYNELILRKEDTVWQEIKEIRTEAIKYVSDVF